MMDGGRCLLLLLLAFSKSLSDNLPSTDLPIQVTTSECNGTLPVFRCTPKICIPEMNVCNGIPDCPEAQDESVKQCGCLPNEFRCTNSCVDIVKRCDRKPDCPGQEDEKDCKTFLCPVTHFKCNNHFCVPLDLVCNFEDDCGDNSDEMKCLHRKCWNPEFRCSNGECLRPAYLCDGHPDCKDGSDETECGPENFRKCGDGTLKHKYYWCDGWPDCPDNHADELNCKECDGKEDFLCPNGRCIKKANVCDAQCDCASENGTYCEDEIGCTNYYTQVQGINVCVVSSTLSCTVPGHTRDNSRCIAAKYLCDGEAHCHSYFSDEYGCVYDESEKGENNGRTFRCLDNRTLPEMLLCDHKYDCLHGDDEEGCPVPFSCGDGMFKCKNGQCVEESARCNVTIECWDKSDEIGCYDVPCQEGMKKCVQGGQCIPESSWCNFFIDCPDASDEKNCLMTQCKEDEFTCENGQCIDKKHQCFNSGKSYEGCADSSHLQNCKDWICEPWQFKCHLGPCLDPSLLCNGRIDCQDTWEDEDGCSFTCSNMAPKCQCKDLHINCTGVGIDVVPSDSEKEITWFYLGSNRLNETLSNETFKYLDRLLYLDLSNNSIKALIPKMFSNLWRLTVLNLQNNQIHVIEENSFFGLGSLKGLHLQGNNIKTLNTMAFIGLSSLANLDLHQQRINMIKPDAFTGLRNLIWLDLSHNEIQFLHDAIFRGMPRLLYL